MAFLLWITVGYILINTTFGHADSSHTFWYGAAALLGLAAIEVLDELKKIRTRLDQIRYIKVKEGDWP